MDLKQVLLDQLSGAAAQKLGARNGLDTNQTGSAVDSALTAILSGLQQNVGSKKQAKKLDEAVAKDHSGAILEDLVGAIDSNRTASEGGKILEHIFGRKTGTVTDKVAENAGVSTSAAGDILATLAPIVLGQLGKTKQSGRLDAGGVADQILRQKLPNNTITSVVTGLLDQNKDGQVVDDLVRMGTSLFRK